jgi:phage baseplate assembly protein W
MRGMNRETGKAMEGRLHLMQSLGDIFTTPIGTRVMRRWYGIDQEFIDRPTSTQSLGLWTYSVADALERAKETRYALESLRVKKVDALGHITIQLVGKDLEQGGLFDMDGLIWR